MPSSVNTEMNDEIHAGRDGRHDERRGNVLAGQQGKGAHLHQSLPSRVRVEGAHSWYSTIKSDQEIEAFRLPDLTDDEAARSHSECLFHQTSEGNLPGAFEIRLPGLHRHDIGQLQLEFEYFLHGHRALAGRNRCAQGIQHRCLSGLRPAGHENVQPGGDTGLEKVCRLLGSEFKATSSSNVAMLSTNLRMFTAR